MKNRIGEENYNSHGTLMKIIKYENSRNVIVEFQDDYKYKKKCQYCQFKEGCVSNPYDKTIYNLGYLGEGKYKTRDKKGHTKIYITWHSMMCRCYDAYYINKEISYKDCYICEEWHNFQNFAKWYEENYYEVKNEKMSLDKDILIKGNKIYSPETCVFVPIRINELFTKSDKARGKYPIGVNYNSKYNILETSCSIFDKEKNKKRRTSLGRFTLSQIDKAFICYKNFKENYIKQIADEYKDLIPIKLYNAMYKYEVEIND